MKHFFLLLISVAFLFNFGTAQNASRLDLNGDIIPPEAIIAEGLQHQIIGDIPEQGGFRSDWMSKGPWGGNIRGFATDKTNGMNVVVACGSSVASNGGMWRSSNGGQTWSGTGLNNKLMYGVVAHPTIGGTYFAGGKYGIYKSTDGGATWLQIAFPSTTIISLGVQNANPDVIVAGIASNLGVKYSIDGGVNFLVSNLTTGFMKDFASSPANPDLMFVAMSGTAGFGLFTSTTGASWTAINPAASGQCYGVYVDPANANFILLGSDNGIFKSTDGGANWSQVQTASNFVRGVVKFGNKFYAPVYNGGIYESTTNGDTWTLSTTNFIEKTWQAAGSTDAGALFGNWGSISRSNGQTYSLSVEGLTNVYVHTAVYYADRHELWAGSEGSGIWVSTDMGETWQNKSNGLQGWWAYSFAPTNHEDWQVNRMLVGTNNGVYVSNDFGESWQILDQESTTYTGTMIDRTNPDKMWIGGTMGPIKFTTNGGSTWTVSAGLPFALYPRFNMCNNPSGNTRILLNYEQMATTSYFSDDLGANYTASTGFTGVSYFTDASIRQAGGGFSQLVYLSTDKGIYKSADGEAYTVCPQLTGLAWSVLGSEGTDVYAGAGNGVFHSGDEGQTWETFNTGIATIAIWDLVYGSSTDVLYAGTRGYGIFKYGDDVLPPGNLVVTVDLTTVLLTWSAPASGLPLGYNVYRDNQLITPSPVVATNYSDEGVEAGTHIYWVTAVYENEESVPAGPVQVIVDGTLGKIHGFVRDAVTNLTISEAVITTAGADNGTLTIMTPFGAYYSMLLTAGNHDVTCIAEGYQPETVTNLPVVAGANKGYTFYLEPSTTENVTGISNPDETINRIYPNPATDQLTITGNRVITVEILNQTGQRVLTVNEFSGDQTINIGNLSAGVYTVRLITNQGIETQKLIVR
jgi:hypothetical protein